MTDTAAASSDDDIDDERGARACYQALHRAFDTTLASHAHQPVLVEALLAQAFDSFHGNVAIQCENEPPLACRRGCATCCVLRVGATAPEVFLVTRFLRAVTPRLADLGIDLIGQLRAADARTRGLDEPGRAAANHSCPFIARGVCVIYSVRPLACRGHASHDVKACMDASAGRRADVPHSHGHRMVRALVQNAMQSSLRDAGFAWHLYELNHALLLAWEDDQAESDWLVGADVLAAAAFDDVPREEMAGVFDQLRPGA